METTNQKFILLIRGYGAWEKLSPAEMQATLKLYGAFSQRLKAEGRLVDAEPLDLVGVVITAENGVLTDGPFVETKEMIGGYYAYWAKDLEEAVAIGRDCPALTYGDSIEIRPVMDYSKA